MTTKRRFGFARVLLVLTESLLISVALMYLAEYAALSLVREAGARVL